MSDIYCIDCGYGLVEMADFYICRNCKRLWPKSILEALKQEAEFFQDLQDSEDNLFMWLVDELNIQSQSQEICIDIDKAIQKEKLSINL